MKKAFKIAKNLVDKGPIKGWEIVEESKRSRIGQNKIARACYIIDAIKKKREKEEREILEELQIEYMEPYTKEPEDLISETIVFPSVNFNIREE